MLSYFQMHLLVSKDILYVIIFFHLIFIHMVYTCNDCCLLFTLYTLVDKRHMDLSNAFWRRVLFSQTDLGCGKDETLS